MFYTLNIAYSSASNIGDSVTTSTDSNENKYLKKILDRFALDFDEKYFKELEDKTKILIASDIEHFNPSRIKLILKLEGILPTEEELSSTSLVLGRIKNKSQNVSTEIDLTKFSNSTKNYRINRCELIFSYNDLTVKDPNEQKAIENELTIYYGDLFKTSLKNLGFKTTIATNPEDIKPFLKKIFISENNLLNTEKLHIKKVTESIDMKDILVSYAPLLYENRKVILNDPLLKLTSIPFSIGSYIGGRLISSLYLEAILELWDKTQEYISDTKKGFIISAGGSLLSGGCTASVVFEDYSKGYAEGNFLGKLFHIAKNAQETCYKKNRELLDNTQFMPYSLNKLILLLKKPELIEN